jgi:glycosyltransferase involved in cell wall biosynthesis
LLLLETVRNPRRLVAFPRSLARIVLRPPASPPRPDFTSDGQVRDVATDVPRAEALVAEADCLIEAGENQAAWERLVEANALRPDDLATIRKLRTHAGRLGDPVAGRALARRMTRVSDTAKHRLQQRISEGNVRELDPTWLPEVPGTPAPLPSASSERVLHFLKGSFPHLVAGATTRSRYTLRAQAAAGLDPVAVTDFQFPRTFDVDDFDLVEEVDGIRHHRLDAGPGVELRLVPNDRQLEIWATLADRVVRLERPAILHAASGSRGYENAVVAHALGRHHGLPVVYEVRSFHEATWTADLDIAELSPLYDLRIARENACMLEADQVVTLAESMREDLVTRGVDPERITVVPNAVDTSHFTPGPRDEVLARELGLEGRTVLGYISNLSRREGVDFLLRAVKILADEGLDVGCLVCGDGPELEGLRALAGELGIADRVRLTGAVPHDEVDRYYQLIDVFVVPRRDDRAARYVTPIKPFEAMALERALIVSDLPALAEIVGAPERGLTFVREDPASLAAVARPLVEDHNARIELGRRARRWVERERSWESNAGRYVDLYARVLEEQASRV